MPATTSTHSTASLLSQKYSRIHVAIISSAEIAELLLHTLSWRAQEECCHSVSGYRCWSSGKRFLGAEARVPCKIPAWIRKEMPEAMLIMARRLGLRHWEVRKLVAQTGSSVEEKEPGISRISKCGAFTKEFCVIHLLVSVFYSRHWWGVDEGRGRTGACVNFYLLRQTVLDDYYILVAKTRRIQRRPKSGFLGHKRSKLAFYGGTNGWYVDGSSERNLKL
jgi:hypothetical protein